MNQKSNHTVKFLGVFIAALLVGSFMTVNSALAKDLKAEKADYQRDVNADIQALEERIAEVREDYKKDGVRVEQKIQAYEDKIAEIKREADRKMDRMDQSAQNKDDKAGMGVGDRVAEIKKDFNEWRLKRAINSYDEKIEDLRDKVADAEYDNPKEKLDLEARIQKLDAKYNTTKAKLNDLRATDGRNWDKIEQELDKSLKEIDRDYEEADARL